MSVNISKLSGRKGLDDNLFQRITAFADEQATPDAGQLALIQAKENLKRQVCQSM